MFKKNKSFIFFVLFYFLYLLTLIWKASFVINNVRYFVLFDDEMISMHYANNLAHGFGLVWDKMGPSVEGFTNPLWTFYMAFFHLFPIPHEKISLFIQITGAILLIVNIYFVRKIINFFTNKAKFMNALTILFIAFYFPLNNWGAILGTEVSLLVLIVTATSYMAIKNLKDKTFSVYVYLILGIATWVRVDAVIPSVVIIMFFVLFDKKNIKKHLFIGFPIFISFLAAQFLLRKWYYNEWLPNTYYLKLTGFPLIRRIMTGLYVFTKFMNWFLLSIPVLIFFIKKNKYVGLLTFLFFAQVAYSIYAGGDAWEFYGGSNRYITPVMPLYFILYFYFATEIKNFITKKIKLKKNMTVVFLSIFLAVTFLSLNFINHFTFLEEVLMKAPIDSLDSAYHINQALDLSKSTNKNATIAVVSAGVVPYFLDRNFVDLLGKSDKKIAREQDKRGCMIYHNFDQYIGCFYPGHMKWDYAYAVGELKPDVVLDPYPIDAAKPYLDKYYVKIGNYYFLKNSKNVNFKNIKS